MPDLDADSGNMFGDDINQFTTEIRQLGDQPPDAMLNALFTRLGEIEPLTSAGMFHQLPETTSLEWVHLSNPSFEFMNESLHTNRADLVHMLTNGGPVQFGPSPESQTGADVFIGVPAGRYNGAQIGLGVSSSRTLEEAELSWLGPLSLTIGLMVENARLSSMLARDSETDQTARLIGFIAHELRTPLTGMRGNIQLALMASRKSQHERIPNRLESAIDSVDNMSALVQKLLDVSRLERGEFPLSLTEARVTDTVSAAVEAIKTDMPGAPWTVQTTFTDEIVIEHDQQAIERAVRYLVETTGQYAEDNSEITISVRESNPMATVVISYAGSAFSREELAALSAPLGGSHSPDAQSDFLSLELAFCRGIVDQHNGQITFYNDSPSSGRHAIELCLPARIN
jgi:K+-sensing histidine kinase KdpD